MSILSGFAPWIVYWVLVGNVPFSAAVLVALAVSVTVIFVVMAAKTIGCILPILAKKVGLDPAVMASPFITTIVDALSLLAYFAVASALLPLFALLGVFAAEDTRRPVVHSPGTLLVGADEAALLEALGALQHGNEDVGMNALDGWLPLVGLCMAAASAQEFGRILASAGVFLPYGRARLNLNLAAAAE